MDLTYNAPWVNGGHAPLKEGRNFRAKEFPYRFGLDGILSSQMSGPTGKSNLSSAQAGDNSTSLAANHLMGRIDSPARPVPSVRAPSLIE